MTLTEQKSKRRPNTLDKHIGKRIQQLRAHRKISQTKLADDLGLSTQQIQKYESGKNRISASNLYIVAKVFKTPLHNFYPDFERDLLTPHKQRWKDFKQLIEDADQVLPTDIWLPSLISSISFWDMEVALKLVTEDSSQSIKTNLTRK